MEKLVQTQGKRNPAPKQLRHTPPILRNKLSGFKHGGATRRILSISGMVSRETSILTTTGRGGEAHSKPSPTTQPPTHHVSRETSIDLSSCHTHRSLKIPQTHPNKLPQFQHPHVSRETPSLSNQ